MGIWCEDVFAQALLSMCCMFLFFFKRIGCSFLTVRAVCTLVMQMQNLAADFEYSFQGKLNIYFVAGLSASLIPLNIFCASSLSLIRIIDSVAQCLAIVRPRC